MMSLNSRKKKGLIKIYDLKGPFYVQTLERDHYNKVYGEQQPQYNRALKNFELGSGNNSGEIPEYWYKRALDKYAYFNGTNAYVGIPSLTLSGAFSIGLYGVFSEDGCYLFSSKDATSEAGSGSFRLTSDGILYVDGTSVYTLSPAQLSDIHSGRYSNVKISRDASGIFTVSVEGYADGTSNSALSGDLTIDSIGSPYSGATPYYEGIMSRINFNNDRCYLLNEAWSDYPVAVDSLSLDGATNGIYNNFDESDVLDSYLINEPAAGEFLYNGDALMYNGEILNYVGAN